MLPKGLNIVDIE